MVAVSAVSALAAPFELSRDSFSSPMLGVVPVVSKPVVEPKYSRDIDRAYIESEIRQVMTYHRQNRRRNCACHRIPHRRR